MTYAGDITPQQAWDLLEADPTAVLIDVRTQAEWLFVGIPDLDDTGRDLVRIEWNRLGGIPNEQFMDEVSALGVDKDAPMLFLCRSGARSMAAASAATEAGYTQAHNVLGGFEGDRDGGGHRGTVNGWKVADLPWLQS